MRSRWMWICAGVVVVAAAVVAILLMTGGGAEGPYALVGWTYGAVGWVQPSPENRGERAERAERLLEDTFALWGYEAPARAEGGRVARKGDPAGGSAVELWALDWKGSLMSPVIVLVFPDRASLQEATGLDRDAVTLIHAMPSQGTYDEQVATASLTEWVVDLVRASVAFLCTADRWEELLVGEVAKWMLMRALEIPEICDCTPYAVPRLVREGIAGYTAARLLGAEDGLEIARTWAAEHGISTSAEDPLNFDVDDETYFALGTSFISYLVGEYEEDGLVGGICGWYSRWSQWCQISTSRTLAHLRGWRAFLGLEEE